MYQATIKRTTKTYVGDIFLRGEEVVLDVQVVHTATSLSSDNRATVSMAILLKGDILEHKEVTTEVDMSNPLDQQIDAIIINSGFFDSIQPA